jgi:hypothetical protein
MVADATVAPISASSTEISLTDLHAAGANGTITAPTLV